MRWEIIEGASSSRMTKISSQRGPLINSDEGKAAYNPPIATDAIKAGQRGSAFFGLRVGCISPNRSFGESVAAYLYL